MGCGRPCLGHGFSFHMILMRPKAEELGVLKHEQSSDVIQKAKSVNGKWYMLACEVHFLLHKMPPL